MTTIKEHVDALLGYGVTVVENALSDDLVEKCKNKGVRTKLT